MSQEEIDLSDFVVDSWTSDGYEVVQRGSTVKLSISGGNAREIVINMDNWSIGIIGMAQLIVDGETIYTDADISFVVMSDRQVQLYYAQDMYSSSGYPTTELYFDGELYARISNTTAEVIEGYIDLPLDTFGSEITIHVEQYLATSFTGNIIPAIAEIDMNIPSKAEDLYFDDKKYLLRTFTTFNSNAANIDSEEKYIVKANITKIA